MNSIKQHYSRIAAFLAVSGILSLFFFPLWQITLEAPQYPGGINMYIWINQITGDSPATLQNINILNHYVGMKFIEPDSIPELQYFPYIIAFLALFGVFAIWKNNRYIYLVWFIIFLLLAILGLYDFYLWEYNYGHNLSPTAPIKVPGQSYQPPLIGSKMLLNFKASSWPHIGGICMGISLLLTFVAFIFTKKKINTMKNIFFLSLIMLICSSCQPEIKPIDYGTAECDYCRMTIVDDQYAAELVNSKSKAFVFDATECMLRFMKDDESINYAMVLVTDYLQPRQLIDAKNAYYIRSKNLPSPMGMYITSVSSKLEAEELQKQHGGEIYNYTILKEEFPSMEPL